MRLLTNGTDIFMISDAGMKHALLPRDICDIPDDMIWNFVHPDILTPSQIRAQWPQLFNPGAPEYIPNLRFMRLDVPEYMAARRAHRKTVPEMGDYLCERRLVRIARKDLIEQTRKKCKRACPPPVSVINNNTTNE